MNPILTRRMALVGFAVAASALTACAATRTQEGTGEYVDDTIITSTTTSSSSGLLFG